MDLGGLSVLGWCVRAAKAIVGIDEVVVAASEDASDDAIEAWCQRNNTRCVRGSLHDVLARYGLAAKLTHAQVVMRLTADCPLLDPEICGAVVQLLHTKKLDYASNFHPRVWPDGVDCEVFTRDALEHALAEATLASDREHVTPFLYTHPEQFHMDGLLCPEEGLEEQRWTLDTKDDFEFLTRLVKHLPKDRPPRYTEVLAVIRSGLF